MIPPLSNVSSKYGAPMGRRDWHTAKRHRKVKFHLVRVPLVGDGVYDAGGAYWGSPSDLWRAISTEDFEVGSYEPQLGRIEFFLRAPSRRRARAAVRRQYPKAKFFR